MCKKYTNSFVLNILSYEVFSCIYYFRVLNAYAFYTFLLWLRKLLKKTKSFVRGTNDCPFFTKRFYTLCLGWIFQQTFLHEPEAKFTIPMRSILNCSCTAIVNMLLNINACFPVHDNTQTQAQNRCKCSYHPWVVQKSLHFTISYQEMLKMMFINLNYHVEWGHSLPLNNSLSHLSVPVITTPHNNL